MQAIRTRYLGPTNTHGARVKAISASGLSATVARDYEKDVEADERRAAVALCRKLGWSGCDRMVRAGLTNEESVFVSLPPSCECPSTAFQGLRRGRR